MDKIASFKVNHLVLEPGVYVSRKDMVGTEVLTTFDLRMTTPNKEPVMNTAELHTLEHICATFLRNHKDYKEDIIDLNSISNSIGEIENYKNSNMRLDLTNFASVIYKNTGISCFSISMKFGNNASEHILSNVKTKIIESLLLLEREFGILDEFCFEEDVISPNKIDKVNEEINSIIFSDGTRY